MKIKNLLILGLVLLGFTYCSSDDVLDGPTPGSDETADNLKMEIAIKMPTGANTRTTSPATGVEAGTTEENKPNSVLIVLVDTDKKIAGTYSSTDTDGSHSGATFFTTAQFKVSGLADGNKFDVYAFVNPYEGLVNKYSAINKPAFDKDAHFNKTEKTGIKTVTGLIDAVTKSGETRNNFFMSNADEVQTVTVEATHIQGAPLKVGINVQRAVARMDYVDKDKEGENPKTYTILNSATIGENNVSVTFVEFKPMNVSKSFFDLKRVNADGKTGTPATIGGAETAENYVVDTDWAAKAGDAWGDLFHSTFETAETDDVEKNYVSMTDAETSKFYVTENTLPADQNNKKGIATAVVFKGYLNFDDSYITGEVGSKNDDYVYVWNNKFYGSFDNLPAGIQAIVGDLETPAEKAADLAKAGVTGYKNESASGETAKYPIYYVYYNVHNQLAEADASNVGPMEFGVVRNNIYKLTINNLSKFGHPNDPEDNDPKNPDPNPENPEDPIKSSDLYMQVTATVLDWTVRTNEIDF